MHINVYKGGRKVRGIPCKRAGAVKLLGVLLLLVSLSGSLWCARADDTKSKMVALDATTDIEKQDTNYNWVKPSGRYKKTTETTTALTITARNASPSLDGEFTIEWWFVAKKLHGSTNGFGQFAQSNGSKTISLKAGTSEVVVAESDPEKLVTKHKIHHPTHEYGKKVEGWIVRAKVGDEVVRVKASTPMLEAMASNKIEFDKFVGEKDDE